MLVRHAICRYITFADALMEKGTKEGMREEVQRVTIFRKGISLTAQEKYVPPQFVNNTRVFCLISPADLGNVGVVKTIVFTSRRLEI